MTYLLIGSMLVLAVALWHKWANRIERDTETTRVVEEARARAAERKGARAFQDTEPNLVDWDLASQVGTALVATDVTEASHLTMEEALTVSLILADVEEIPTVDKTGLDVSEINMDNEHWNIKRG